MNKYVIIVCVFSLYSCGFYTVDSLGEKRRNENAQITMPFGHKKAKKNIQPSLEFIESVKAYRFAIGAFPASMQQLEYYNEKSKIAVGGMRQLGFKKMEVSYSLLDSMIIDFTHDPVYTQQIGTTDLRFHVNGKFIFTVRDSSFSTRTLVK
ncbi:hypothetical protein [Chitinophaga polysaccharea]|uniref:hypothetical protein n=1 Tax=Chitinophaga polysaccharea TaxID=1293035 RepID=UPI0011575F6D|nr:hypothetical protein [Chitinophaga polysaccharea]